MLHNVLKSVVWYEWALRWRHCVYMVSWMILKYMVTHSNKHADTGPWTILAAISAIFFANFTQTAIVGNPFCSFCQFVPSYCNHAVQCLLISNHNVELPGEHLVATDITTTQILASDNACLSIEFSTKLSTKFPRNSILMLCELYAIKPWLRLMLCV